MTPQTREHKPMTKSSVEPSCTGQFSSLFLDYLAAKPELSEFYSFFPNLENFQNATSQKQFSAESRAKLKAALVHQYEAVADLEVTNKQIDSLTDEHTFTVTTGHQLNLFTGPLYFIYKIVSTINLADRLNQAYPHLHFIPVYWMATEDHDFDEINYFKLNGIKYQWECPQKGPVGDFLLDESFREFFKTVEAIVPGFFKEAYLGSNKLSEAVRKYVHHLFGEKGLLIVDGHDASLKESLIPVIQKDIFSDNIHQLATAQSQKLEEMGYKAQIFPREINFFYMEEGLRERIEKTERGFKVVNTGIQWSTDELSQIIAEDPERFSPNVVLRPLYQEMILPNVAYLGGPAEVIYWLQLKPIFDHFSVPFPIILPRNFALVFDTLAQRKIKQLELSDRELFEPVLDWKKRFVQENASGDFSLSEEKRIMDALLDVAGRRAEELEKSLGKSFNAAKVRAGKILQQLSEKLRKAEERRLDIQIRRREAIYDYMNPGGSPQERVENFMRFYLEDPDFLETLFIHFDPLDFRYMILKIEDDQG